MNNSIIPQTPSEEKEAPIQEAGFVDIRKEVLIHETGFADIEVKFDELEYLAEIIAIDLAKKSPKHTDIKAKARKQAETILKKNPNALKEILAKTMEEGSKTFDMVLQGRETNIFTRTTRKGAKKERVKDGALCLLPRRGDDIFFSLTEFETVKGLRSSTFQLLDILTRDTQSRNGNSFAQVPLKEYMALRGLKDAKTAREQVNEDLETLARATIHIKGDGDDYIKVAIVADRGIEKGVVRVSFGPMFSALLAKYKVMPYPRLLYRLDNRRHPHSFYLLRRISEHKNTNFRKHNADTIAVNTLLEACPGMPRYEGIKTGGRQLAQRIIEPFERDMDALTEVLTWEYCIEGGTYFKKSQNAKMDWPTFSKLMISIHWKEYPTRTQEEYSDKVGYR